MACRTFRQTLGISHVHPGTARHSLRYILPSFECIGSVVAESALAPPLVVDRTDRRGYGRERPEPSMDVGKAIADRCIGWRWGVSIRYIAFARCIPASGDFIFYEWVLNNAQCSFPATNMHIQAYIAERKKHVVYSSTWETTFAREHSMQPSMQDTSLSPCPITCVSLANAVSHMACMGGLGTVSAPVSPAFW